MINANELKIGNIFWENYGGYKQVVGILHSKYEGHVIHATGIGYKAIGEYSLKDCYPVPTSPEVLERLGFKQETPDNKYGEVYRKDKFRFIIRKVDFGVFPNTDLGWAFELSDDKNWATIVSKVEYAHQIQNLFFALTNTELTYNPNQP